MGEESIHLLGEWDPISLKERCNFAVRVALLIRDPRRTVSGSFITLVLRWTLGYTSDNVQGMFCQDMFNVGVQNFFLNKTLIEARSRVSGRF